MAIVEIPNTNISYYMDNRLKSNLDNKIIPNQEKKDKDTVLVIDGFEGSGKSTLAFQIGKYCDNSLDLSRVCFNAEEFENAIYKAEKGQCVIYDEAFTGLSSRSVLSEINRTLVSLMMQMRQKNLLVLIVLPTIFMLDKYVALFRTRSLIHIYENKGRRGYFLVFNGKKKKELFYKGKKTFNYYVKTKFKGRFMGKFALGDKSVEDEYRRKKEEALKSKKKHQVGMKEEKYMENFHKAVYLIRTTQKLSEVKTANLLKQYGIEISGTDVGVICRKMRQNTHHPTQNIV